MFIRLGALFFFVVVGGDTLYSAFSAASVLDFVVRAGLGTVLLLLAIMIFSSIKAGGIRRQRYLPPHRPS